MIKPTEIWQYFSETNCINSLNRWYYVEVHIELPHFPNNYASYLSVRYAYSNEIGLSFQNLRCSWADKYLIRNVDSVNLASWFWPLLLLFNTKTRTRILRRQHIHFNDNVVSISASRNTNLSSDSYGSALVLSCDQEYCTQSIMTSNASGLDSPVSAILILLVCVVAVFLNIGLLVLLYRTRKPYASTDVFLANLAVSGIILTGICVPLQVQQALIGELSYSAAGKLTPTKFIKLRPMRPWCIRNFIFCSNFTVIFSKADN